MTAMSDNAPADKSYVSTGAASPNNSRALWPKHVDRIMSPFALAVRVQIMDALIILSSGFLTYTIAVAPVEGLRSDFLSAIPAFTLLALLSIHSFAAYRLPHLRVAVKQIWRPVLGCLTAALAVLAVLFFLKVGAEVSRMWVISWLMLTSILLTLQRFILQRKIDHWTRQGLLARRTVIVGGGAAAARLIMA
ncbi:MAG: hypothetical protein V4691_03615, partial [Pseudomonadota bacterium]